MDDSLTPGARAHTESLDDVVGRALSRFLLLPGVIRVGVALVEGAGRRLRFTASDRDRDHSTAVDWCFIDAYEDVPLTTVVRTGEPIMAALDDLDARFGALVEQQREQSVEALAAVPLLDRGAPVGGVVLFYERTQVFDLAQRDLLLTGAGVLAEQVRTVQIRLPRAQLELPQEQPGSSVVQTAQVYVDADPRAVALARRFVRQRLAAWGADDDVIADAVLCVSELVTNAVIHTGSPSLVLARLEDGMVTVTVRDQGAEPGHCPSDPLGFAARADPLDVHGRGLQFVEALANRWGFELDEVGTTVWFEVALIT